MHLRSRLVQERDRGRIGSRRRTGPVGRQQSPRATSGPSSVSPEELTLGKVLAEAVERVVSRWWATGRLPGSLEDFLFRRRPRFLRNPEGPIIPEGTGTLDGAIAAVLDMRSTSLCVQGPPGSGKT